MSKLNGFISVCVLAFISSTANAQMTIVIDNQPIPTSHIQSITILPGTGQMNIITTIGYDITPTSVGDGVAITSFIFTPASVLANETSSLSWETSNADSCSASGGVDGWNTTDIGAIGLVNGSRDVSTSTLGSHIFTLTCNGTETGDTVALSATLTVNALNAVAITEFYALPVTISAGGSTIIGWATNNATTCTPSGGTGGWNSVDIASIGLASGETNITATTEGAIQFALTCQDADGGQTTSNVIVTVEPEADNCPTPNLSGRTVDWGDQWGTAFPGPTYKTTTIALPRYGYHAIEFNTGQVDDDGRVLGIENTNTTGIVFGAISKCPGDFNVTRDCKYKWGLGGSIDWSTNNSSYSCEMDADTTYYLNLTFTDGDNPEETTCTSNLCNATMQHRNY